MLNNKIHVTRLLVDRILFVEMSMESVYVRVFWDLSEVHHHVDLNVLLIQTVCLRNRALIRNVLILVREAVHRMLYAMLLIISPFVIVPSDTMEMLTVDVYQLVN